MKILISGATGFVGRPLVNELTNQGHEIFSLRRTRHLKDNEVFWDINNNKIKLPNESYFDAVLHLAGENVSSYLWSKEQKERIYNSRVLSSRLLVKKILALNVKPKVFISASAIGFYGNRSDEVLDETSTIGTGFLASVCKDWEESSLVLREHNIRTINTRFSLILAKNGGALKKMLPPFQFGIGGNLGNGNQYMSWIALKDVVQAIIFCLNNEQISGAVNFCSPQAIRNREFTQLLAKSLGRPAFLHIPRFVLKLIFGQMAEELLLSSSNVKPNVLIKNNFKFQFENLEDYFKFLFHK